MGPEVREIGMMIEAGKCIHEKLCYKCVKKTEERRRIRHGSKSRSRRQVYTDALLH